ncbi:MAG: tRNA epoxyqueuosine(34) reductase QueG [Thermoanaerobaculia bacterium]
MTSRLSEIWTDLQTLAEDEGALFIGATGFPAGDNEPFERWLDRGFEAGMHYLRRHAVIRRNPAERFPWARSVVVLTFPYSPDRPAAGDTIDTRIARYAQGDDYHQVLDLLLRKVESKITERVPDAKSWRYVDTGPLSDRAAATAAGAGWIGKNAMLIHEKYGSYFFIATLLTSLENDIEPDRVADRCGRCTRCIDACPTEAIVPDRMIDSNRCISYLTIEHRGAIAPALATQREGNLFGCDICQEVCPWNSDAPPGLSAFETRETYRATPVSDLLRLEQEAFSTLFRRSAVKRARRDGIMRNAALIATGSPEYP